MSSFTLKRAPIEYNGSFTNMLQIACNALTTTTIDGVGRMQLPSIQVKEAAGYIETKLILVRLGSDKPQEFTLRVGKHSVFQAARTQHYCALPLLNSWMGTYMSGLRRNLSVPDGNPCITKMPKGLAGIDGFNYFLELVLYEAKAPTDVKIVLSTPLTDEILSQDEIMLRALGVSEELSKALEIYKYPGLALSLASFAVFVYMCLINKSAVEPEKYFYFPGASAVVGVEPTKDGPKISVCVKEAHTEETYRLDRMLTGLAKIHYSPAVQQKTHLVF